MVRISNNISLQDTVKISGLSTAPVERHTAPSVPPPVDTLPAVGLRTSVMRRRKARRSSIQWRATGGGIGWSSDVS